MMPEHWEQAVCNRWGIEEADIECQNCFHWQAAIQARVRCAGEYYTMAPCVCPEPDGVGVTGARHEALPMTQPEDYCRNFYPHRNAVDEDKAWVPYEY